MDNPSTRPILTPARLMRVLVACEFSGVVRDAFASRGHYAFSCDLLPSGAKGFHRQGDVRYILNNRWDLMVAHPPCTYLCVSGARWFKDRIEEQETALEFVRTLLNAPIPKICLENPVGVISTRIRKPDQVIQPWQFGHAENKRTCLWLKGLPKLRPTNNLKNPDPTNLDFIDSFLLSTGKLDVNIEDRVHRMAPSPERSKLRSVTYQGIAQAMVDQWG